MQTRALLEETAGYAAGFLDGLPDRPVNAAATVAELRAALAGPVPAAPTDAQVVVRELREVAERGVVAMAGGRYFGFVIGGAVPAALAADWLVSTWDQNAGLFAAGPAAAVAEEVAGTWVKDLLGLPADASFAFVTGCQLAHVTCLAAARHQVLADVGWDVEQDGLFGAPPVRIVAGADRHVTLDRALRFLGLGPRRLELVPTDDQGRMEPERLAAVLATRHGEPMIVCLQAGEVNTGAFDDLARLVPMAKAAGAWVHVDGAFGLWAAASPALRQLVAGHEGADSWATDGHKWLNVPYDCGIAVCAHPAAHRAAMGASASYLVQGDDGGPRDAMDWTPEFSRRARSMPVYAAIRSLGRSGVADLVDRCCARARQFAAALQAAPGVTVLNDVVLNQVLVRFGDDDAHTRAVISRVQAGGECWMSGTTWHGRAAMRISVSNWRTTEADVERAVAAILTAHGVGQLPAQAPRTVTERPNVG